MKRLNNKGITTIEVIVSFVIVVIITASLYSTVSNYNQKRLIESYKSKIYTYKNYADTALNSEYLRGLIAWIAQYNHYCTYTGSYVGWQYSSSEKIPGINTNVDISVWFK